MRLEEVYIARFIRAICIIVHRIQNFVWARAYILFCLWELVRRVRGWQPTARGITWTALAVKPIFPVV